MDSPRRFITAAPTQQQQHAQLIPTHPMKGHGVLKALGYCRSSFPPSTVICIQRVGLLGFIFHSIQAHVHKLRKRGLYVYKYSSNQGHSYPHILICFKININKNKACPTCAIKIQLNTICSGESQHCYTTFEKKMRRQVKSSLALLDSNHTVCYGIVILVTLY